MSGLHVSKLRQVMLPCSDLARAAAFYRDVLGAKPIGEFPPGLAFFDLSGTRLLLERHDAPEPGGSALYFAVENIEATTAALRERGVEIDAEPHLIFRDAEGTFGAPGEEEWMAFLRDPDGNVLALAERRRS